jgi:acyl-CoA thioester hydrolase
MSHSTHIPEASEFPLSRQVDIRFVDVDAMGHVNNAHYATYFEEARSAYMRALFPEEDRLDDLGESFPFILLDLYCRYLSPARLGDVLDVGIRLSRLGGKSFEFEYLVTSRTDGRAIATGKTTQVYYNYTTASTELIPGSLREAFIRIDGEAG